MAAKLTGAGGGGCAITLITGTDEQLNLLRDALWYYLPSIFGQIISSLHREHGFDTYISKVGGFGVKWHGHTPPPAPSTIMRVGRLVTTSTNSDASIESSASKYLDIFSFLTSLPLDRHLFNPQ